MQEELNDLKSRVKALEEKFDQKAGQVEAEEKPKFECSVDTQKIDVKEHNICYEKLKELGYKELILRYDGCIGRPDKYLYKVIDNDEKKVHECFSLEGIKDFIKKQSKKA
ncbi:MAG: hypothetical protein F6J94_24210 [Moorea sp. SIO1F2]|uniref:hypothetical protein n=1 Tax=unclassified Moorena TaxID=2683338 RepID=UPI0013BC9542|nr:MULTISPECIES: hypothetical protein [unclassified Moorena]NEN94675.1 hypothetical protein [Moorena sp. SIO3I7]NEO07111.1 hypothetical protein [Moorena sp. SIO3I8]NET84905.1 hypothetical protein [Moorena sp. SIO1F2]